MTIENVSAVSATCVCGHVDYAPVDRGDLLAGFTVTVEHGTRDAVGYACKVAHMARVAKPLAEGLSKSVGDDEDDEDGGDNRTTVHEEEPTGLLAE